MKFKTRKLIICIIAMVTLMFASASIVAAAGSITLNPTSQAAGGSVIVTGTGFHASDSVGIGVGTTVAVTGEVITTFAGTGTGPYTATLAHYPIVPGSFSMHWDTAGTASDWTDNGDGTLATTSTYSAGSLINYATGLFGRSSTLDLSTYALTATCSYSYYQYKVTPTAGVTANSTGGFSTTITVPSTLANGPYTLTAVDMNGTVGTQTLTVVPAGPESLTFGMIVALSSVAIVASVFLWKRPTVKSKYTKL
jgi:hypothetical protein